MTLQYLKPQPDDFGLAEEELLVDGPVLALQEHGLMAEEPPIEAWHWRKAGFGKAAQPIDRGTHIDMRRLVKIIRRRGKKMRVVAAVMDRIACSAESSGMCSRTSMQVTRS